MKTKQLNQYQKNLVMNGCLALIGVLIWAKNPTLGAFTFGVGIAWLAQSFQDHRAGQKQSKLRQSLAKEESAVSPVVGVILMVAITVVLAAIVFVLVNNLGKNTQETPQIAFQADHGNLTVIQASTNVWWSDIGVTGCTTVPTTGTVMAGQTMSGCGSAVTVVYKPTNAVVYKR